MAGGRFELNPGGKGANQAVAAARAGADVVMVGAVGADEFGARLVDDLAAEGVDTAGVLRLPQVASGVAAIVVDGAGEPDRGGVEGANHGLKADDVTGAVARLDLSRALRPVQLRARGRGGAGGRGAWPPRAA